MRSTTKARRKAAPTRWQTAALVLGAATTAAVGVIAPPAQAKAGHHHSLPLPGYGAMVVDNTHEHAFVSGGSTGNGIVVTNLRGRIKATIDNEPGAAALALSADDSRLYVALSQGDGISVIDTSTLTELARYSTGAQTCPTYLARTGTVLWYGYGCESDWHGKIGKLDTAAAKPEPEGDQQGDAVFYRAPLVSAASRDTGPVIAAQLTLSQSNVHVYAVNGGRLDAGAAGEVVGSDLNDVSVTADGATMFTASGSRDHVEAFTPADLSRTGAYATAPHPNAVAVSPDSTYLAVAPGLAEKRASAVLVYRVGATQAVDVSCEWHADDVVAAHGLAWSGDMSRLFVITQPGDGSSVPTLHVIDQPIRDDR